MGKCGEEQGKRRRARKQGSEEGGARVSGEERGRAGKVGK